MAISPRSSILAVAAFFLSLSLSFSDSSVHDILPKYGLPRGLLPSSVKSYSFSDDDGRFLVELHNPCYVQFEYLVYYDSRITGTLRYGSITDLEGIQVHRFFLWLSVDEIKVDLPPSDSIYFQVGFVNKKLDIGQFKTVPDCRNSKDLLSCLTSRKDFFELPPLLDDETPRARA